MIEPINSSSKFWEMERGHVTSSSNRLSRDQVMTFHAFGCHTQRNVKAVHVENHVRKNLGRTIISGSDFLSHQTPTMFTGVDFLHSRIFYIMSKCHDLQKKKQDPCHRSFFCALSQVPSAARLVRPGRVAREWRIVARQVPVRNVYLNQQWWKGGEKKAQPKVDGNKLETKTMLPRQSQTLIRSPFLRGISLFLRA